MKSSLSQKKKTKKDQTERNKENQKKGVKGEKLVTDSLSKQKIWNHKLVNIGYGTVFDKLILPPGHGYAVEVKYYTSHKIPYSKIEPNERKGLDKFLRQVGKGHAYIIGIWSTEGRAFLIPWEEVRDSVLSGVKGSIDMLMFQELEKTGKSSWNLSVMWAKLINIEDNTIISEFINYCYKEANGDYEKFAFMLYYGLANPQTGKQTMERFKLFSDSVV